MTKKILIILIVLLIGVSTGIFINNLLERSSNSATAEDLRFDDQEATIRAIKKVNPAVVSIIVQEKKESVIINLLTGERTIEKEKTEESSGSGFLISPNGLIMTNKHVVNVDDEKTAEFRVIINTGEEYLAKLVGKDPLRDLAILQIFDNDLPYVEFGDSDDLQIGTTVIAIGNALGRYQNSVTKGIVSGLGRSIYASDQSGSGEFLDNVIQTDAEINRGNSGGPLINLEGSVVGINVAIDESGSAIGFSIPINDARPIINSLKRVGRIIRPRLGIRYIMLTPKIAKEKNVSRNSGALIVRGDDGSSAILPDSPADKAGLEERDIIYEINAIKIENNNTLFSVIQKYKPGDKIGLKIKRRDKDIIKIVELDEFK